ncbi:hypothetical protein FRC0414_02334 [Corynebacterium diphtheriae]|nr:hypothetical protein FRC0414_02334 [Corynebacterium diphtheriae]
MLSFDHDTLAVLQIDDLKRGLSDDHAVPGAEATRHDVGEVQALLDEHLRISTPPPHITQPLLNESHVVIRQGLHLRVMPARDRLRGRSVMQGAAQLPLRELVRGGSLLGSLRGGLRQPGLQRCRRRAGQPAVRSRGAEQCVLVRHQQSLPLAPAAARTWTGQPRRACLRQLPG